MGVPVKVITLGLLTLGLASWVVFLAGTATLHKFFADIPAINFRSGKDFFIHSLLGYSWWAVWATFVMLLISIAATLAGKLQEASRLLGLLATASFTMNTWVTDSTSLYKTINNQVSELVADDIETKFDVWLAGSVMSTAMAGILMLWFGSLDMLMTAPERKDVTMTAARYVDSSAGVASAGVASAVPTTTDGPVSVRIPADSVNE